MSEQRISDSLDRCFEKASNLNAEANARAAMLAEAIAKTLDELDLVFGLAAPRLRVALAATAPEVEAWLRDKRREWRIDGATSTYAEAMYNTMSDSRSTTARIREAAAVFVDARWPADAPAKPDAPKGGET